MHIFRNHDKKVKNAKKKKKKKNENLFFRIQLMHIFRLWQKTSAKLQINHLTTVRGVAHTMYLLSEVGTTLYGIAEKRITKTRLYNFDPLKPHSYIVKLGFTGVYIIFLISA